VTALQKPAWLVPQHGLWPADFKAAVAALLLVLRRKVAGQLGGMMGAMGGAGQAGAAGPQAAFPPEVVVNIVQQLAAQWSVPGAEEEEDEPAAKAQDG